MNHQTIMVKNNLKFLNILNNIKNKYFLNKTFIEIKKKFKIKIYIIGGFLKNIVNKKCNNSKFYSDKIDIDIVLKVDSLKFKEINYHSINLFFSSLKIKKPNKNNYYKYQKYYFDNFFRSNYKFLKILEKYFQTKMNMFFSFKIQNHIFLKEKKINFTLDISLLKKEVEYYDNSIVLFIPTGKITKDYLRRDFKSNAVYKNLISNKYINLSNLIQKDKIISLKTIYRDISRIIRLLRFILKEKDIRLYFFQNINKIIVYLNIFSDKIEKYSNNKYIKRAIFLETKKFLYSIKNHFKFNDRNKKNFFFIMIIIIILRFISFLNKKNQKNFAALSLIILMIFKYIRVIEKN